MELLLFVSGTVAWYIHPLFLMSCVLTFGNLDILHTYLGPRGKEMYHQVSRLNKCTLRIPVYEQLNKYFLKCVDFTIFLMLNIVRKHMSNLSTYVLQQNVQRKRKLNQSNIEFYTSVINNMDNIIKQHQQ